MHKECPNIFTLCLKIIGTQTSNEINTIKTNKTRNLGKKLKKNLKNYNFTFEILKSIQK